MGFPMSATRLSTSLIRELAVITPRRWLLIKALSWLTKALTWFAAAVVLAFASDFCAACKVLIRLLVWPLLRLRAAT